MNVNKVTIAGRLTRDPEVRVTSSGLSVCKLGIAINRNWTTKDGEKREEVTFVDATAFGKTGEVIGQHFQKGKVIYIEGRLSASEWETKDGQKRHKLEVNIDGFQFVGSKNDQQGGQQRSAPPSTAPKSAPSSSDDGDEAVPF